MSDELHAAAILDALTAIADHLENRREISVGIFVGSDVREIREAIDRARLFAPCAKHDRCDCDACRPGSAPTITYEK